ncbi:hypothetical protein BU23DRAFT_556657 [Bimuria novae-zelandiae CBS 107.79]|uniref:Rhodopsin domain-containing protein n=1 Tax=Bimuria novae-zelandiae CBS 107.79 TaxID=1447943 RepID=A0A6A5VBU4_9PLEO|nr:hypothetical protein BU23DRAFT_556657 [Bimuria novae-zelandiae CBS 107.79]
MDPPSLLNEVVVATAIVQIVTLLFILIRFYENLYSRQLRAEDYFSYGAWGALIAQAILLCINTVEGIASHMWDVPVSVLIEGSRRYNYIFMCYTISGGFAKATVFMQFKRIFTSPRIQDEVYWVITVSVVLNAVAYTIFLFLYVFTCLPRERIWNPTVEGRCMDSNRLNVAIGGLNVLSDVEAFLVPVWAVWKLKMDVKKKISILAVFAAGALAVAVGLIGLYYRVLILERPDSTWLLMQTGLICEGELGIVIVVGCCPYIPRIIHRHRRSQNLASHYGSNNSRKQNGRNVPGKVPTGWSFPKIPVRTSASRQEIKQSWWPKRDV